VPRSRAFFTTLLSRALSVGELELAPVLLFWPGAGAGFGRATAAPPAQISSALHALHMVRLIVCALVFVAQASHVALPLAGCTVPNGHAEHVFAPVCAVPAAHAEHLTCATAAICPLAHCLHVALPLSAW